jgi:uncharacterized protein YndB with AHSA1/START domain
MTTATAPKHVFEVYIRTTPEKLWAALTSREANRKFFGLDVESDWREGARYRYSFLADFSMGDRTFHTGDSAHTGVILEMDPPRRLVQTFEISAEFTGGDDVVTQVTWEIVQTGDACKLTLVHEGWASESDAFQSSRSGWAQILSSLKSLMETGQALTFA